MNDPTRLKQVNPQLDKLTIRFVLEHIAQKNSPITYGDLAKKVGEARGHIISAQGFAEVLGRIQVYCKELNLPALPAMVVNQSFKPGPGFMPMYLELHPEDREMTEREVFLKEQKSVRSCANWQLLYDYVGITDPLPFMHDVIAEDKANQTLEEGRRIAHKITEEITRNPEARKICLAHKGERCFVCEKTSEEVYGIEGIIHVHHLKPISDFEDTHTVDPIKDLIPVCPTCHAVIHSKNNPCYTPNEVRAMIGLPPLDNYESLPNGDE